MATTTMSSLAAADLAHIIHPLTRHAQLDEQGPVIVVEGRGVEVVLEDGRVFLDGSAGLWNVNVGHGRKELAAAAAAQMETLAFSPTFGAFSHPPAIHLATRIAELAPGDLDAVHFTSGGSEANESAFKFARYWWRLHGKADKQVILSHERGYHGLSLGASSATGIDAYHGDFGPSAADFERIPAPYMYRCSAGVPCDPETCPVCSGAALEARIAEVGADRVAAVIVEPVLGTGGVIPPPPGYLRARARGLRPQRRADDRRRGHHRLRTHRTLVRGQPRRRRARHADVRQGRDERLPATRRRDRPAQIRDALHDADPGSARCTASPTPATR